MTIKERIEELQKNEDIKKISEMLEKENEKIEDPDLRWHICCICGRKFRGWGNNPWPVAYGKCCDDCNHDVVIDARLEYLKMWEK